MLDREANGEEPSPTLVIADAQSTKSGPNQGGSGLLVSGYDGGKKVKGYKRHIVTDKDGRFLEGIVTPADANDRYVLARVIAYMKPLYPFMKIVLGDSGYSGQDYAIEFKERTNCELEVVKRSETDAGFKPNRRWPVERTIALLNQPRNLSKVYERHAQNAEAWLKIAEIRLTLRRFCELQAVV